MKAKLLKRMNVGGKTYNAGEVLDVKDWKNLKNLVSNRYIEIVFEEEKPEPKKAKEKEVTK